MKISEQWLREWVNPDLSSEALGHQLTMAGLEVDAIDAIPPAPEKVVVGKVLELNPHPNADKLRICSVDIGSDEPISIVCGASNVVVGGLYPVATIGAVLPGNFKIKFSKKRLNKIRFEIFCVYISETLSACTRGFSAVRRNPNATR